MSSASAKWWWTTQHARQAVYEADGVGASALVGQAPPGGRGHQPNYPLVDGRRRLRAVRQAGVRQAPRWADHERPPCGVAVMLLTAQQREFHPDCVLFDSGYASNANLRLVRQCGWRWLTQLRSNRRVDMQRQGYRAVSECAIAATGTVAGLKEYGQIRVFRAVAPNGTRSIGPRTTWRWTPPSGDCCSREQAWGIAVYHRALEQECHAEYAMVRAGRTQRNHIGLAIRSDSASHKHSHKNAPIRPHCKLNLCLLVFLTSPVLQARLTIIFPALRLSPTSKTGESLCRQTVYVENNGRSCYRAHYRASPVVAGAVGSVSASR